MIDNILEACMLVCFAAAWPFAIYKSWTSKSTKGKSLFFLLVLFAGYCFGIANKFVMNQVSYVLFFYFIDLALVGIDIALYIRNYRYEKSLGQNDAGIL